MNNSKTGIVKFFKADKGYGFIICNEDNKDYFVHFKNCKDRIEGGFNVSFDVIESKKGVMATNVKLLG
jgi:CspA family cold shock protein